MSISAGDKVEFVKELSKIKTKVPLGEVGIVTDIDDAAENGLTICVTYKYKQIEGLDYEWFMEDELFVITDEFSVVTDALEVVGE